MKSYLKEIAVFKRLDEMMKRTKSNTNLEPLVGFPDMISHLEGQKSAEILMEALGPNLRKLLK